MHTRNIARIRRYHNKVPIWREVARWLLQQQPQQQSRTRGEFARHVTNKGVARGEVAQTWQKAFQEQQ
eukprot:11931424-Prorocentrum_lima.AAC.1